MVDILKKNYVPTTGGITRFYWNNERTAGLSQTKEFGHGTYRLTTLEIYLSFKDKPIEFPTGSQKLIGAIERPGKDFMVILEEDGKQQQATYLNNRIKRVVPTYELVADCTTYAPDAIIALID